MVAGDASAEPTQDGAREAHDRSRRRTAKIVFGLASLVAVVLAVVVFISKDEPEPDRALAAAALAILGLIPVARYLVPSSDLQAAVGRVKSVTVVNDQPLRQRAAVQRAEAHRGARQARGRGPAGLPVGHDVACAIAGQKLPDRQYHLDRMLKPLIRRGEIGCCSTCLDARGLGEQPLV